MKIYLIIIDVTGDIGESSTNFMKTYDSLFLVHSSYGVKLRSYKRMRIGVTLNSAIRFIKPTVYTIGLF
jgi:hypothetical protein